MAGLLAQTAPDSIYTVKWASMSQAKQEIELQNWMACVGWLF